MNIYLIAAESYHLINQEVAKIIKDSEYLSFNLNTVSIEDLIKEASYLSLTEKIIVASNANIFTSNKSSEKDTELLINYLNNPNPNTTIIFTSLNPIDSRKKVTKLIKDKYKLINILPFTYKDKENFINSYVKANGFSIDYNSVSYIMNNTSNLDIIYNELDKIFLYYGKKTKIEYNDVVKIVGSLIDDNNFHFVNAVINRSLEEALKLFKNLKVYKVEPLSLIILLAREYRLMYYLKRYQAAKLDKSEIAKKLALQDWQLNKLYTNSISYKEEELLTNLKMLADIDIGIKTGIFDKDVALINFLIEVCN